MGQHGYTRIDVNYGVWYAPGEVLMLVHVDDIQMFGTSNGIYKLSNILESTFMMKWLGNLGEHLYLGLQLIQDCIKKEILIG